MLLFRCNFPERQLTHLLFKGGGKGGGKGCINGRVRRKKNTDEKKIYKLSEVLAEMKFSIILTSNELYSNNCLTIRLTVKHS